MFGGGKGFTFGTPTTSSSTGTTGGFNFGSPAATSSGSTGFMLGGTPASGAGTTGGFKLGGAPSSGTAGFTFGASATPGTTTSTATPGFGGFGQAQTGFGLAAPATATSTSSTGFKGFATGFGGTPASTAAPSLSLGTSTTTTTAPGGNAMLSGLLGTPKTTASTTPQATGFGLGGATQTTTTTASAFTGFKIGAAPASTASAGFSFSKPATAITTATSSAATSVTSGFGFSALGTSTTTATTSAAPSAGGFKFPAAATTTATATTSTTGTGASLSGTVPGTQMTYRQMEEQINKWMGELENQERVFLQQATLVNAWDRLLVDNGEKITQLNGDMERVKVDQGKMEQELEFIKSQQRELEDLLVPLEKTLEQLPTSSLQPHADLERENTYQLADNIDAQLKRMVQDLKEIIDHLNTSGRSQDTNDPILQITKILNAHMDSLQWIDNNTALLGRRVEDISKQMENQKKDQERNFRLVYDQ